MSKTETVEVKQLVAVTVDETKFTPEFYAEFVRHFYPYHTLDDHIRHLAQLYARGLVADYKPFIEGYGPAEEMGISFKEVRGSLETEIL